MSGPRAIPKDTVPRPSVLVRRRHYADRRFLLRHTEIYLVDELTDTVWLACAEGLTVEQIAQRLAGRGLPLGEALAATIGALAWFEELGFIEL